MDLFDNFLNEFGQVIQKDYDEGDCLNRTSFAIWLGKPYLSGLLLLHISKGIWVRSNKSPWFNPNPFTYEKWSVSRDQMIPLFAALNNSLNEQAMELNQLTKDRFNKYLRFQSGDLAFPHHFDFVNQENTLLGGTTLCIDTLFYCARTWYDETFHDVMNLFILIKEMNKINPTWLTKFSWYLANKFLRLGFRGHLKEYFKPESKAPPFYELLLEKNLL